jgi:putative ABC transport system permease protein
MVLVTSAGVLVKSFANLMRVDPGFDASDVMTFSMNLPPARYPEPAKQAEFYRRLVESVEALPGVQSAGVVNFLPMIGATRFKFFCPEGAVCQGVGKDPIIALRQVTPDYLKTMRIPLLRGRQFDQHDIDGAKPVAIINQWTANHFFPNQDPLGKHLAQSREMIPMEIVGVVGDTRFQGLSTPSFQEFYLPQAQSPFAAMTLVVRSQSDQQSLVEAVRRRTLELDADLPFSDVASMASVISASTAQPRLTAQLTTFFGALALLLTAIGIYGVLAYSVAQRRHEMGVRMALGAPATDILMLVVGQGMRLVLIGLVLGFVTSLASTRLIESLLFGTSVRDPFTLATVTLLLTMVALLACYLPARRASRVDPLIVLRCE